MAQHNQPDFPIPNLWEGEDDAQQRYDAIFSEECVKCGERCDPSESEFVNGGFVCPNCLEARNPDSTTKVHP